MFNVLNEDGVKIQVEKVDTKIHKHVSGRDFTKDDNVEFITVAKKVVTPKKTITPKKK